MDKDTYYVFEITTGYSLQYVGGFSNMPDARAKIKQLGSNCIVLKGIVPFIRQTK